MLYLTTGDYRYHFSQGTPIVNIKVKHALSSTIFLKAVSLIMGFLFWSVLSNSFTSYIWVTVPVAFYNRGDEKIEATEKVTVELKGKRSHLKNLDTAALSLHVDAQSLKPGPNSIEVVPDLLFLPATITVGETVPHTLMIYVTGVKND